MAMLEPTTTGIVGAICAFLAVKAYDTFLGKSKEQSKLLFQNTLDIGVMSVKIEYISNQLKSLIPREICTNPNCTHKSCQ